MAELTGGKQTLVFKGSRYWSSNVWGATVAGGIVLSIVVAILLFDSEGNKGTTDCTALILAVVASLLAMFPGNMIATVPIAVEFDNGGLWLIASLKKLYIPIEEVREARNSTAWQIFQQGVVVTLNKRHGLMKSFIIHRAFGTEGKQLARAIQGEIAPRGASSG